jgi:hypothetical protein
MLVRTAAVCLDPGGVSEFHFLLLLFEVPVQTVLLELIVTLHIPPNFSEGYLQMATVPLFMRLRELYCINPCSPVATGGQHNDFDDGLAKAWLPVTRINRS